MSAPHLQRLLSWYETLSPQSLADIAHYYAAQAQFRDPFNDVIGLAPIHAIFEHMFATTQAPRFVFQNRLLDGNQAFVTWRFDCVVRRRLWQVHGSTYLRFDEAGLVVEHRDYWDAAQELYEKLPLIGPLLRLIKRTMR